MNTMPKRQKIIARKDFRIIIKSPQHMQQLLQRPVALFLHAIAIQKKDINQAIKPHTINPIKIANDLAVSASKSGIFILSIVVSKVVKVSIPSCIPSLRVVQAAFVVSTALLTKLMIFAISVVFVDKVFRLFNSTPISVLISVVKAPIESGVIVDDPSLGAMTFLDWKSV